MVRKGIILFGKSEIAAYKLEFINNYQAVLSVKHKDAYIPFKEIIYLKVWIK